VGETTDQIETHIRETRQHLSANLNELEQKVKSVTDWRQQYQKSPGTFLAVAAGGGLLLAMLTRRPRMNQPAPAESVTPVTPARRLDFAAIRSKVPSELDHSLGDIKSALIGVVTSQAKSVLSKFVPGFEDHLAANAKAAARPAPSNDRDNPRGRYDNRTNGGDQDGSGHEPSGGDYATHQ
jgi:hypothetical protein